MKITEVAVGEGKRGRTLWVTTNKEGFVVGIGDRDGDAWDSLADLVRAGFLVRAGTHQGEDVYRVVRAVPKQAAPEADAVEMVA